MGEFNFEILKHIGVISTSRNGWSKEVNIISWNDSTPKIDVRDWSPDHVKMGRGLTFTGEEAGNLCRMLHELMEGR